MILHHIDQLEARIRDAAAISEEQKQELLGLIRALRQEAEKVPAAEINGGELTPSSERSTEEVMSEINSSVADLEASHPRLTQLTNQVAVVLSNMGI